MSARITSRELLQRKLIDISLCPCRRYGTKCGGCGQGLAPSDLVRKARDKVFHLNCFTCCICRKQLSTGEQLHVLDDNKFICKEDYLLGKGHHNSLTGEWEREGEKKETVKVHYSTAICRPGLCSDWKLFLFHSPHPRGAMEMSLLPLLFYIQHNNPHGGFASTPGCDGVEKMDPLDKRAEVDGRGTRIAHVLPKGYFIVQSGMVELTVCTGREADRTRIRRRVCMRAEPSQRWCFLEYYCIE